MQNEPENTAKTSPPWLNLKTDRALRRDMMTRKPSKRARRSSELTDCAI